MNPCRLGRYSLFFLLCLLSGVRSLLAEPRLCHQPDAQLQSSVPQWFAAQEDQRMYLESDALDRDASGRWLLQGPVKLRRGNTRLESRDVVLQVEAGQAEFAHSIQLQTDQAELESSQGGKLDLHAGTGRLNDTRYAFQSRHIYGRAAQLVFSPGHLQLYHARYTRCPPESPHWLFQAESLELDFTTETGKAHGVSLRFYDWPLLYLPYLEFPLGDQRKSGLLPPSFGISGQSGLEYSQPYYFNLAPNLDATLTPHVLYRRGLQLEGEGRFLTSHHRGQLNMAWLAHDRLTGSTRGSLAYQQRGRLGRHSALHADLRYISDNDYLKDFGNQLNNSSQTHLERVLGISAWQGFWRWGGRVQGFQTIDPGIAVRDRPYQRLPQIQLLHEPVARYRNGGFSWLRLNWSRFERRNSVTGSRSRLFVGQSYGQRHAAGDWMGRLGWHVLNLRLDQPFGTVQRTSIAVPEVLLQARLHAWRSQRTGWRQSLVPQAQYLYRPYRQQNRLPVFDSARNAWDVDHLFAESPFSGGDRISDSQYLSLMLASTLWQEGATQPVWRGRMGQRIYLNTGRVHLPGEVSDSRRYSDWVADSRLHLARDWTADTFVQWRPGSRRMQRQQWQLRWKPEQGSSQLRLGQQFERDVLNQFDLALSWQLNPQWRPLLRWNYSLRHQRILEGVIGVRYDSCCWAATVLMRSHVRDANERLTTQLMFQLELKGLSSFGNQSGAVLGEDFDD